MIYYFAILFLFSQIGRIICEEKKDCPYDFKVNKLEGEKDVEKWIKNCDMKLGKINKTHSAINGKCSLIKSVPWDAMFELLGYERDENNNQAYRDEPTFNITRPLCEFISNDKSIWPQLIISSKNTFPTNCPIDPRLTELDNYMIDSRSFPPNPPSDFWLMHLIVHENKEVTSPALTGAKIYIELIRSKKCKKGGEKKEDKKEDKKEEKKEDKKEKGKKDNKKGGKRGR